MTAPLRVLGPDESPIALIAPPEHRSAVMASLRVTGLRMGMEHGRQRAKLILNVTRKPPVPLSFQVFVRSGQFEQQIGRFSARDGSTGVSGFEEYFRDFPPDASAVDVIFRPDPASVEGQADWTEIWGQEIIIERVPVLGAGPRSDRPAAAGE